MRKLSFVVGLCLVLALVLNVMAMQRSHPDVMKDIGAARRSMQGNIEAGSGDAAAADASKLEGFFKELVPMYEGKDFDMGPAIEMANKAAAAAAAAATAAKAGDMEAAMAAHGNVVAGCRGCHSQYREKAEDGSYSIKKPGS